MCAQIQPTFSRHLPNSAKGAQHLPIVAQIGPHISRTRLGSAKLSPRSTHIGVADARCWRTLQTTSTEIGLKLTDFVQESADLGNMLMKFGLSSTSLWPLWAVGADPDLGQSDRVDVVAVGRPFGPSYRAPRRSLARACSRVKMCLAAKSDARGLVARSGSSTPRGKHKRRKRFQKLVGRNGVGGERCTVGTSMTCVGIDRKSGSFSAFCGQYRYFGGTSTRFAQASQVVRCDRLARAHPGCGSPPLPRQDSFSISSRGDALPANRWGVGVSAVPRLCPVSARRR